MSDQFPEDPVERRIAAALTAFATTEVPASAPRPGRAPRPGDRPATHRSRRWGIAGGSLLVAAAALVLALLLGTEVFDARVAPTAPPATDGSSAPPATTAAPSTPTSPSTTATPGTPTSAPPATTPPVAPVPGTSVSGGPVACRVGNTTVTVTTASGADGHGGDLVHVVNTSTEPCVTTGYPGVALLDDAGGQLYQAQRTPSGYLAPSGAGPVTLVLPPQGEATAVVEGVDPEPTTGGACPTSPALLVTLPDETHSVSVGHATAYCGQLQVHPLVAGATGGEPFAS